MSPNHAIYEAEVTRQLAAGEQPDPLHLAGCRPGFVAALSAKPASPTLPPSRTHTEQEYADLFGFSDNHPNLVRMIDKVA
jgi:hypothetical protein